MSVDTQHPIPADRRALRLPLLLALVAAAAGALLLQPRIVASVREGTLAAWALWLTPAAFAVAVSLVALDVWRAWRAHRSGNFGWLMIAIAFVGVLAPQTWSEYRTRTSPPAESVALYAKLLRHNDARVRTVVLDAVTYRPFTNAEAAPLLRIGLKDSDPLVQRAALHAVQHRSGTAATGAAMPGVEQALSILDGW